MVRDEQLVFYTGCLGSKWSRFSIVLRQSPLFRFNLSDNDDHRHFRIGEKVSNTVEPDLPNHQGAYWGTGMEFGDGFEDLPSNYTKTEFVKECMRPFRDVNSTSHYLIKAHGFAHNLNWLAEKFPKSKIIMVTRPPVNALDEWLNYGGFDIPYPSYTYYQNEMVAQSDNNRQVASTHNFILNNNLTHHTVSRASVQSLLKIDMSDPQSMAYRLTTAISYRKENVPLCEVMFAGYNIPEWNFYK